MEALLEAAAVLLPLAYLLVAVDYGFLFFGDRTFLPHGSAKDGYPAEQPVWLTVAEENPNGAQVLFLTDGTTSTQLEAFELCADLFDGNDEAAVTAARARWSACKEAGHAVTYWRQTERGGWEQVG